MWKSPFDASIDQKDYACRQRSDRSNNPNGCGAYTEVHNTRIGRENALIAYPDADIDRLVDGITRGMNFTWAGQSCGSMSRVFLHESHHDEVLARVVVKVSTTYRPGIPTDPPRQWAHWSVKQHKTVS